jgi:hypothetical protein
MLLVNSPIAFNAVGESHDEGTFHGILCEEEQYWW